MSVRNEKCSVWWTGSCPVCSSSDKLYGTCQHCEVDEGRKCQNGGVHSNPTGLSFLGKYAFLVFLVHLKPGIFLVCGSWSVVWDQASLSATRWRCYSGTALMVWWLKLIMLLLDNISNLVARRSFVNKRHLYSFNLLIWMIELAHFLKHVNSNLTVWPIRVKSWGNFL